MLVHPVPLPCLAPPCLSLSCLTSPCLAFPCLASASFAWQLPNTNTLHLPSNCLPAVQTKYGSPLALPLFIALAQSRNQNIIGVDRGVGSFNRKPAESRIRIVSGRYDNANKLMIQVSTPSLPYNRPLYDLTVKRLYTSTSCHTAAGPCHWVIWVYPLLSTQWSHALQWVEKFLMVFSGDFL